ncbi:hypothetical protein SCANM63S_00674 [Streptomyces canarius]
MYAPGSVTWSPSPGAADAVPGTPTGIAASPAPRTVPPSTVLRLTCADDIPHPSSPSGIYLLTGMTNSGGTRRRGERVVRAE